MDYLPALWTALALLSIIVVGALFRIAGVIKREHIFVINRFVFMACLPFLVFKACANQKVYELDWTYVVSFLLLRVVGALIYVPFLLFVNSFTLEQFTSTYMATTWVDTIVYGIPILSSLFGPSAGSLYPVLASISSFIFQLPFMIVMFELSKVMQKRRKGYEPVADSDLHVSVQQEGGEPMNANQNTFPENAEYRNETTSQSAKRITLLVPPLYGIILGLIYALLDIKKMPDVMTDFLGYMGGIVTGTISFLVGVFAVDIKDFFFKVWKKTLAFVGFKLLIFPLLVIPIQMLLGIKGDAAVSGVILAAMPIAFPAFSLAKQYEISSELMTSCICLGTILMLPVIICWIQLTTTLGL